MPTVSPPATTAVCFITNDFIHSLHPFDFSVEIVLQYQVEKFNFRIRTRSGVVVDKVSLSGRDVEDAGRRLQQIYPGCEVLETWSGEPVQARESSLEDVIDRITLS